MSGVTPELGLGTAVDADDTADYLVLTLANSLRAVDALFNNTTGHTHTGAHQGGPLTSDIDVDTITFPNGGVIKEGPPAGGLQITGATPLQVIGLTATGNALVGGILTVNGDSNLRNTGVTGNLTVTGAATLQAASVQTALTVATTLGVGGAGTFGGLLTVAAGGLTVAAGPASFASTLITYGAMVANAGLTVNGAEIVNGTLTSTSHTSLVSGGVAGSLAFFGSPGNGRQAMGGAALDLATVIALANNIRAGLLAYGLMS